MAAPSAPPATDALWASIAPAERAAFCAAILRLCLHLYRQEQEHTKEQSA